MSVEHWTSEGMDWTNPSQIKPTWPYLEALRLAIIERCEAYGRPPSINIGGSGEQLPYQNINLTTSTGISPCSVFPLLYGMTSLVASLSSWYYDSGFYNGYIDHEVNDGNYSGLSAFPFYSQTSMLIKIGENNFYHPLSPYPMTYSVVPYSELMIKLYKALNQMRWLATRPSNIVSRQKKYGYAEVQTDPYDLTEQDVSDVMDAAEANWASADWIDTTTEYVAKQRSKYWTYWGQPTVQGEIVNVRYKVSSVSTIKHTAHFYAYCYNNPYDDAYYYNSTDGFVENAYNMYSESTVEAYSHESNYIMETKQKKAELNHTYECTANVFNYANNRPSGIVVRKYDTPNGFQFGDWRGD